MLIIFLGTYVYYDTQNTPLAPLQNGFIGGIYKDGSIAFVGRGNNAVRNQNPCPARISTNGSSGAGAYMPAGDVFDARSSYYILAHQDLHWVTTDKDNMKNVPGALHFTGSGFAFSHGRVVINNHAYIGKIHDDSSFNYIGDSGTEVTMESGFEILVCDPSLSTSSQTCSNKIESGYCIVSGQDLWSCSGCMKLSFQADGNLVVYKKSGGIVWATNTMDSGATTACMHSNGKFVLYDANNVVKWSTSWTVANTDTQAVAMIQDDGQFVIVAGGQTKYKSGNTAACEP